jgi:hypothetical protein
MNTLRKIRAYIEWLNAFYWLHYKVVRLERRIRRMRRVMHDICYCDGNVQCENCHGYSRLNGQLISARLAVAFWEKRRP